jgi:hypothetical protein
VPLRLTKAATAILEYLNMNSPEKSRRTTRRGFVAKSVDGGHRVTRWFQRGAHFVVCSVFMRIGKAPLQRAKRLPAARKSRRLI